VHGKAQDQLLQDLPLLKWLPKHKDGDGHSGETHGLQGWQLAAANKRAAVLIVYFIAKSFKIVAIMWAAM